MYSAVLTPSLMIFLYHYCCCYHNLATLTVSDLIADPDTSLEWRHGGGGGENYKAVWNRQGYSDYGSQRQGTILWVGLHRIAWVVWHLERHRMVWEELCRPGRLVGHFCFFFKTMMVPSKETLPSPQSTHDGLREVLSPRTNWWHRRKLLGARE